MTDDERPTLPGTIEAAAAGSDDEHDRDTIPAPEPVRAEIRPSDSAPTPSVPMRLATADEVASEQIETLRDSEVEIETVRPPPPPSDAGIAPASAAKVASSSGIEPALRGGATPVASARTGAVDQSSIAPRELSQRPAPPPGGQRRAIGLIAAATLLGLGLLAIQRADRDARAPHAAAPGANADNAAPAPGSTGDVDRAAVPSSAPVVTATPAQPEAVPAEGTAPAAPSEGAAPLALATTAERAGTGIGGTARRRADRVRDAQIVPTGDLPETPSREVIAAGLHDLRGAIELCSDGRSGVAELDLTIRGSGVLAHAVVGGDFAGTPQGSCIARTLRGARFAPFQQQKFRVLYKLML